MSLLKRWFGNGASNNSGSPGDTTTLPEPDLTLERARNEMQLRTEAAIGLWGMDQASWAVDLEEGTIVFTNPTRGVRVTAPVQVIGTLNSEDGTWLWGWDHPSVPEPIGEHARLARAFGERYGLPAFTTLKIAASMDECWTFTALACHLAGAQGGYSGPSGPARVFMTFGTPAIVKLGA
jgi:hypothetical protein